MKLYLAARFRRREELVGYADQIKSMGHEITSSWVYGGEDGMTFNQIAQLDISDVMKSDGLVGFGEIYGAEFSGGGRHAEFGAALALNKKLYVVGGKEHVFHWYPGVIDFPRFDHFLNYLKGK